MAQSVMRQVPSKSLAIWLSTLPTAWEDPLWHTVQPHAHTDTLCQAIFIWQLIQLVSDATIHPSVMACMLGLFGQLVNYGVGKVMFPAQTRHVLQLSQSLWHLYCLELFPSVSFLYPLTQEHPQPLHVYCDNSGVIDHINNHPSLLYPLDTIQDDYPIFAKIHHHIVQLQPFSFVFHHVTGHQTKKSEWPLTIPEQLNIDCNARASKMPPPPHYLKLAHHPSNDAGYPHLCISNSIATQCLQHTLRDTAT